MRRGVGIGCITLAVILVVGIAVYALSQRNAPGTVYVPLPLPGGTNEPPITCKTPEHKAGDSVVSLKSGGVKRSFLVHLPPTYGRQEQPLVLNYHGYSWTAQIMEHNSQMAQESDRSNFILVFPQGLGDPPTWNAGVGAFGPTGDDDDVQYTRDLLTYLQKNYCVDMHRLYMAGFSLGGGMVYRLACTMADRIAAIATVSGAYYPFGDCNAKKPLPVMEIHGGADTQAPYGGNPDRMMASVHDYLSVWREIDKCTGDASVFFTKEDVTGMEWKKCTAGTEIRHYRVGNGGHTWPGTPNTTHAIIANQVIWQFFSRFSR